MVTKKSESPPSPSLSAPCYCLYVSQLITSPLDQAGWLTMGKQCDTDLGTHTHSQPGNRNYKKTPPGWSTHAARFKAISVPIIFQTWCKQRRKLKLPASGGRRELSKQCNETAATITLHPEHNQTHKHKLFTPDVSAEQMRLMKTAAEHELELQVPIILIMD